jgi:ferritin
VKKAVKTAAAKKPAPKKTATAAKKAAPKKATATKTAASKTAKKPAAKKATPKKRVKKPLTDEEKLQAKIRQLRVKALKEPVRPRAYTAINAFVSETRASNSSFTETIEAFRNLTPAELEVIPICLHVETPMC